MWRQRQWQWTRRRVAPALKVHQLIETASVDVELTSLADGGGDSSGGSSSGHIDNDSAGGLVAVELVRSAMALAVDLLSRRRQR